MHPIPQQRLFEKAIAVFLREATTIVLGHLRQGDDRIEHDEPAHARIPFAAFGRFALDLDHRQVQFPILLKMQVIPTADLDLAARRLLLSVDLIGSPVGLSTFPLKEWTIFGRRSAWVPPYGHAI